MTSDAHQANLTDLKHKLLITPKTVSILSQLGIVDHRSLQHLSPNQLLSQIAALPSIKPELVNSYRRAARRMVWLGTQDEPEVMAKRCTDWTNKISKAKGVWVDGFDDLTGRDVDERFGRVLQAGLC